MYGVGGDDDDVGGVQQEVAGGLGEHRVDEVDLVHRLEGRGVVGDVLHRDSPAEDILRAADARRDVGDGLAGERQRQQVVELAAAVAAGAPVLAVDGDVVRVEEADRTGEV